MSYFNNVRFVDYKFGNSDISTLHQDLGAYVDLIDQVRDNSSFYKKYTIIDGDRPDTLSYKLYGSSKYYWTFFLMNEKLRERGWPLTNQELLALVQNERRNTVLTTNDDLTGRFNIGSTITGVSSSQTGVIVDRRLDLGQIIVKGLVEFSPTEQVTVTEDETLQTIRLIGVVDQYLSLYNYEDSDGVWVDINPYEEAPGIYSAVSWYDRYVRENDEIKEIIIIKPSSIDAIFQQFQESMSNN